MSLMFDTLDQFDRLASSLLDTARAPRVMPVDLFRDGDQYVLSADLPGIDPQSLDIDLDGQLLTIRAERTDAGHENASWIRRERATGSFMRQFTLGDGVDADKITASYDAGVLSVIIPIAERAKPRKIGVSTGHAGASQPEMKAVSA